MIDLGLLGIFSAGLLTFVTPCVLPLIPIYLSALVGADISRIDSTARGQLLIRALLFSLGFIAVFTLMGLTASAIGGLLVKHKAILSGAGAILILVFGLKFLGLIRIPFFDKIIRANDSKFQTRFGSINALVMGVVFAAGWSPCVGPVLGSVLTYTASNTASPIQGAAYLAVYGFGFALPLLVTAIFAEAGIKFLKRINPLLPKIERAIGVFLVLVAMLLIFDIVPALDATDSEEIQNNELAAITGGNPLMVEFYSSSCTICEKMEPVVDSLSNQCNGKMVEIKKVDISKPENKHYQQKFRLIGVPTFLFLSDTEKEVARLVGEQTEQTLKQALSALRGKPCPGLAVFNEEGLISSEPMELSFPIQDEEAVALCNETKTEKDSCDSSTN